MSLRLRLFLLIGGLIALLAGAQWWWMRSLTQDLGNQAGEVAFLVGESVVSAFVQDDHMGLHTMVTGTSTGTSTSTGSDSGEQEHQVFDFRFQGNETHSDSHVVSGSHTSGEGTADVDEPRRIQVVTESRTEHTIEVRRLDPGDVRVTREWTAATTAPLSAEQLKRLEFERFEVRNQDLSGSETDPEEAGPIVLRLLEEDGQESELLLGNSHLVHRIPIPRSPLVQPLKRFSDRFLLGSAGILLLGLLLAGLLAHRVTAPLYRLSRAAREVGEGALGTQVPVHTGGEVGATLTAFNRMSRHLQELDSDARRLRAREHLGELGEVARGLAHSLRNPLNALGLSVETLTTSDQEDERLQLADAARRQIRRMDSALRSFLALASGGGGEPEPVSLTALLQDVALEALQDANGGRVRVDLEPGPELPPLRAVAPELRAVLQALVINAVEASPAGGSVTVKASSPTQDRWRVEILDCGPGLPATVRERLFTPHTSTKPHGSGMGLYLAQRIASNRYGGELQLLEREDGGTRAVLDLAPRCGGSE